jgi:hypothetical protein
MLDGKVRVFLLTTIGRGATEAARVTQNGATDQTALLSLLFAAFPPL